MASNWSRTAAFRYYNTEPRNPNWSWSARSADGKTVAITLWRHDFAGPAGRMVYARDGLGDWYNGLGSQAFLKDLMWALMKCEGCVRVIVAVRDERVSPRVRTRECYPQKDLVMRVTHVNVETGAFRLEQLITKPIAVDSPSLTSETRSAHG